MAYTLDTRNKNTLSPCLGAVGGGVVGVHKQLEGTMRQMGQWAARGLVGLLGLVASSTYAGSAPGGVVGYAPGSVAVPTLSEWTLIGLGLLLVGWSAAAIGHETAGVEAKSCAASS